jgi:hypothetical protein
MKPAQISFPLLTNRSNNTINHCWRKKESITDRSDYVNEKYSIRPTVIHCATYEHRPRMRRIILRSVMDNWIPLPWLETVKGLLVKYFLANRCHDWRGRHSCIKE